MLTKKRYLEFGLSAVLLGHALAHQAEAVQVRVTITSLAPQNGTFFTPVWIGFHDGDFDLYNLNEPAPAYIERAAEDGDTAPVTTAFIAAGYDTQTTLASGDSIPVFAPGAANSMVFDLNPTAHRYFSFLSMVIPSNDAFFANGDPTGHELFDASGNFKPHDFTVLGANVRDAGTEVNDELPINTAFLGQTTANTGVPENGVISIHPGFIPGGNILSTAEFADADFTRAGYQLARIQVSAVPLPAALPMMLGGLGLLGARWGFGRRLGKIVCASSV